MIDSNKKMLKDYVARTLQKLGVQVSRSPSSGFEYLLQKQRYRKHTVSLMGIPFEIADGHSFYYSHREIFIDEIYKFKCDSKQPTIIDCGSNYGVSILYFKQLYPSAKIVGVEADPRIYEMLNNNIARTNINSVTLLNKAVSNHIGSIEFFSEGADGGRVHKMDEPKNTSSVDTVALDDLIDGEVDFLKMDIEGSESDVLCASKKLNKVKQLFIEYHSFVDETQNLGDLLSCLAKNNFRYYIHTQFCSKNPLIDNQIQLGMDLQLNIFAKQS
jgi:FkbM family methyltransferase